ncbi:hypothetical protein ACIBBB_12170 [Streptomyces sp. NPDC051217]
MAILFTLGIAPLSYPATGEPAPAVCAAGGALGRPAPRRADPAG